MRWGYRTAGDDCKQVLPERKALATPGWTGVESLEPRLMLSAAMPGQEPYAPLSASQESVQAAATGDQVVYLEQTQYDNFFKPNVIVFDFPVQADAVNGMIEIEALSDLDHTSERVAYNIEGIVTGELWTGTDDGVRPFTATISLNNPDLAALAADGNLHIEFTPSSAVDDFANVDEYVTVGLTYEVPLVGTIAGRVWADLNADGVHDPDEPGIAGARVFLDDDDNGQLDWTDADGNGAWSEGEGERWMSTAEDIVATTGFDEAGRYVFDGLTGGEYHVVIEPGIGQRLTTQAGPEWSDPPVLTESLTAPDSYPYLSFGRRVEVWGSRLMSVATMQPEDGYLGGAYVYHQSTDGYQLESVLRVPAGVGIDRLDLNQAALGDEWAAMSGWVQEGGSEQPAIAMFRRVGSAWTFDSVVRPTGLTAPVSYRTAPVAMAGNVLTVASVVTQQAWVFEFQDGAWAQVAELTPGDLDPSGDDAFGARVAMDEHTIVISAYEQPDALGNEGALYVYERVDGVWTQTAKLMHVATVQGQLGKSLAVSGDLIVAGGPTRRGSSTFRGYAYVFRKSPDQGWQYEQRLEGAGAIYSEEVGRSVAIVGDAIAVHSYHYSIGGNVYLFEQIDGTWVQTNKLTEDSQGTGVGAVHTVDETLIINDSNYDGRMGNEGRLTFYRPHDTPYRVTVTLGENEAVSLGGVGVTQAAPSVRLLPAYDSGADDTDRHTIFNNHDPATRLGFAVEGVAPGSVVTLYREDGTVIGAGTAVDNTVEILTDGVTVLADGLQYIEARITLPTGQTWSARQWIELVIDTTAPVIELAPQSTVAIKPKLTGQIDDPATSLTVTVGGVTVEAAVDGSGRWTVDAGALPALAVGVHDVFVHAVDTAGNTADALFEDALTATEPARIEGVVWQDVNGNGVRDPEDTRRPMIAVYLDLNVDGQWTPGEPRQFTSQDDTDTPENEAGRYLFDNLAEDDYFVRLDNVDGAYRVTSPGSVESQWGSMQIDSTLQGVTPVQYVGYGYDVDSSEHTLVVGSYFYSAYYHNSAATIYTREGYGSPWEFSAYVGPETFDISRTSIGVSVATNDRFVFIGAPNDRETYLGSGGYPGAFYIYERNDGSGQWIQRAKVFGDKNEIEYLGGALAADTQTLVVGGGDGPYNAGGVYVYNQDPASPAGWTRSALLKATEAAGDGSNFGQTVALSGDLIAVGAPWDDEFDDYAGAVYVYRRNSSDPTSWDLIQKIPPPPPTNRSTFGGQLAMLGDTIVVGNGKTTYIYEPEPGNPDQWHLVTQIDYTETYFVLGDFTVGPDTIVVNGESVSLVLAYDPTSATKWHIAEVLPRQLHADIDGEYLIAGTPWVGAQYQGAVDIYQFTGDNPWHYIQLAPGQVIDDGDFGIEFPLEGDLNRDGFVGIEDLNLVLDHWNQTVSVGNLTQGDISGDGFVGIEDLNRILGNWNAGTQPSATARKASTSAMTVSDSSTQPGETSSSKPSGHTRTMNDVTGGQAQGFIRQTQTNQAAIVAWQQQDRLASFKEGTGYVPWSLHTLEEPAALGLWEDTNPIQP